MLTIRCHGPPSSHPHDTWSTTWRPMRWPEGWKRPLLPSRYATVMRERGAPFYYCLIAVFSTVCSSKRSKRAERRRTPGTTLSLLCGARADHVQDRHAQTCPSKSRLRRRNVLARVATGARGGRRSPQSPTAVNWGLQTSPSRCTRAVAVSMSVSSPPPTDRWSGTARCASRSPAHAPLHGEWTRHARARIDVLVGGATALVGIDGADPFAQAVLSQSCAGTRLAALAHKRFACPSPVGELQPLALSRYERLR